MRIQPEPLYRWTAFSQINHEVHIIELCCRCILLALEWPLVSPACCCQLAPRASDSCCRMPQVFPCSQEKHCSFSAAQVCWQRVNCQQCDRRTKLDCYRPLAYCSVSKLSSVSTYNGNILPCAYSKICYAAAMLQQPRVPPTGQRQAVEIQIKWREVLAQKQAMLKILSQTTGHSPEKLDKVGQGSPFMKVMQAPA